MITLVSDNASLLGEFTACADALIRFRFRSTVGGAVYASPWNKLTGATADMAAAVGSFLAADNAWQQFGPQTKSEYLRMREGGPSKFPLPEEVYARVHAAYDTYVPARIALTERLLQLTGAESLCELEPDGKPGVGKRYAYRNGTLWTSRRSLTPEQWRALIDRETSRDESLLSSLTDGNGDKANTPGARSISIEVRREVWRRDNGRCAVCGSQERLEFDHIIPVAMGGGGTARNVQLLCERCNREKGATLG